MAVHPLTPQRRTTPPPKPTPPRPPRALPAPAPLRNVPWLHTPHATVHSAHVADVWLAWHSMHRSIMWLRQMAHVSTTMSHAHSATALYFLISNRFFSVLDAAPPAVATAVDEDAPAAPPTGPVATASISMAAADQGRRQEGEGQTSKQRQSSAKEWGEGGGGGRMWYEQQQQLEREGGSGWWAVNSQRRGDHDSRWPQRRGRGARAQAASRSRPE